jgi:hypothetical protein
LSRSKPILPKPGEGDIDVFIYCQDVPTSQQRKVMLASLPEWQPTPEGDQIQDEHWGQGVQSVYFNSCSWAGRQEHLINPSKSWMTWSGDWEDWLKLKTKVTTETGI